MSLTVILGAGTSRGAEHIDPERPPPLLQELPRVLAAAFDFPRPRRLELTQLSWYSDAITSSPCWPDDFETFMTSLELGKAIISVGRPAAQADPSSSPPTFLQVTRAFLGREDDDAIALALEVVEAYKDSPHLLFSMINFFREAIRRRLHASFTNHYCHWHARLFQTLRPDSCVVNFNYDQVGDFTLVSAACPPSDAVSGEPTTVILPHLFKHYFYQTDKVYRAHHDALLATFRKTRILVQR